jgi:hypothetical protein
MGFLLVLAVAAVVCVIGFAVWLVSEHGPGPVAWRWFSGQPLDGKHRTNASWTRPGTKALHVTGHAVRWHHLPRASRAAVRTGATLGTVATLWGLANDLVLTLVILAVVAVLATTFGSWRAVLALRALRHNRRWVTPLHRALAPVLSISSAERPTSWLEVERDRSAATIWLPAAFSPSTRLKEAISGTVAAKLALEAPEADWSRLDGPRPVVRFAAAPPPPKSVKAADIIPAIDAAKATDLVLGLGRSARPVAASLDDDSPHVMLSQGSGSGKSTTGRLIGAQVLYKGAVLMIWDYKRISQAWARGLPNVVYCKSAEEIHAGALWLLAEIERRNKVADAGADIEGNVHANVGPRIIVLAEEMNATMNRLRAYWREIGDGNRSPAVEAIEDASFMGRQVLCNIVFIGQKMSVRASASGEARETMGIRVLGRYTASTWKMLVSEVPYVPSRNEPGRVQVVTGGKARETQVGYLTGHQARELALAGTVSPWPSPIPGMPHLTNVSVPIGQNGNGSPDQGNVIETVPPDDGVSLADAVALGVVEDVTLAALRKASHRDRGKSFPEPVGRKGLAALYDPEALQEWERSRPRASAGQR